jgi:EpsI family protein
VAVLVVLGVAGGAFALSRAEPPHWNQKMAGQALPATIEMGGRLWQGHDMEMSAHAVQLLRTNDYLLRRYTAPGATAVDLCVIFSQDNREAAHPPEICLEGQGQEIVDSGEVVVPNVEGRGDVRCRKLVTTSAGESELFLYIYKCGKDYTPSYSGQQFAIFARGLFARNVSGALVRVSTPVADDAESALRRAKMMLATAIPYLDRSLP